MQSGQPQRPMQRSMQPQRPQYRPQPMQSQPPQQSRQSQQRQPQQQAYQPQQPRFSPQQQPRLPQPSRSQSRYTPQYEPQQEQEQASPGFSGEDYSDYGAYNEPSMNRGNRGGSMGRGMDRGMDRGGFSGREMSMDRGMGGRREYQPPQLAMQQPQPQEDPSMGHPFSPFRQKSQQTQQAQQAPMSRGGPMFDPDQAAAMESSARSQMTQYGGPAKGVSQLTQRDEPQSFMSGSPTGGYGGGYRTEPSYDKPSGGFGKRYINSGGPSLGADPEYAVNY